MRELRTQRLVLRRFVAEDAEQLYQNCGTDPEVSRYVSFVPYADLVSTRDFVQMHVARYDEDSLFCGWAIELDGQVIGTIGLFNVEPGFSCELGYTLGSAWWGQGLATEAARAVRDYAFGELGMHRLYASYHVENGASGAVLQKLGMRREGVLRDGQLNADGSFSNLVLCAVLSTDRAE